jgi:hypothetical protein
VMHHAKTVTHHAKTVTLVTLKPSRSSRYPVDTMNLGMNLVNMN